MLKRSITCVLVLFLSVNYGHSKYTEPENEWDLLIFTQHWPITICKKWSRHGRHTCSMPKNENAWSIHGIWPTKIGTEGPSFCNKTWKFDVKKVQPIETQLEQSWINIENGTALYDLWKHEWEKHGTCAAVLEPLNSELRYFTKGLNWLQSYMMTDILNLDNILPSDDKKYKVADFYLPIKKKLGVEPEIRCEYLDGKQYIFELRICFTKNFQLRDCSANGISEMVNDNTDYITNCNSLHGIIYPRNVNEPKRYLVQLYKLITWLQWFTL